MSTLRDGVTFAELMAKRDHQRAIWAAERAVLEAAGRWYDARSHGIVATSPLALAVQALRELEAQDAANVR